MASRPARQHYPDQELCRPWLAAGGSDGTAVNTHGQAATFELDDVAADRYLCDAEPFGHARGAHTAPQL